jgi:hypothetical protein
MQACRRTRTPERARSHGCRRVRTVEPPIVELMAVLFEHDKSWHEERLRMLEDRVRTAGRTFQSAGRTDWLDGASAPVTADGARPAQAGGIGFAENIRPSRLCRPRFPGPPTSVPRCSAGGFHWQVTDRLIVSDANHLLAERERQCVERSWRGVAAHGCKLRSSTYVCADDSRCD